MYKMKETSFKNIKDMKKKFTTVALALVAALGIGAAAQTATPATCNRANKARCEQQRPDRQNRDSVEMAVLFEGITLTPEQKTKLQTLRDSRKEARTAKAEQAKQQRADRRKQAVEMKRQRLADMKQILTPEQYVVYLENIVVNQPSQPAMRAGKDGRMARKNNAGKDMKAYAGDRARNARPTKTAAN